MRPEDNKKRDNSSYLHTGPAPGGVCVEYLPPGAGPCQIRYPRNRQGARKI